MTMPDPRDPEALGPGEELLAAIDIFGTTDPGKVRSVNEDQFFVASLHKSMRVRQTSVEDFARFARLHSSFAYLLVVADGVGGLGGGKQASSTAVAALAEHIGETIGCYYNLDVEKEHDFLSQLELAVTRAHERVRQEHSAEGRGPATTLTMVALVWPRAYIVHVGDSRAYFLRGDRLRQITRDQTAYEEVVDQGTMTEEEARRAGLKNMLTSALGASIKPSIGLIDLEPGDALLLCTDGLTKHLSDDDIKAELDAGGSAEACCRRLVGRTLERGAKDNVTVIVGRFAPR
jgi:serine/threonine protein phosphatase PrpC